MRKLIAGIHRFQKREWSANRELYRRLAEHGQFPEALFITCSDARVDPVTITHGQPGDLFIVFRDSKVVSTARVAIAEVVLLKVEERAATALVTYSDDAIALGDVVERR